MWALTEHLKQAVWWLSGLSLDSQLGQGLSCIFMFSLCLCGFPSGAMIFLHHQNMYIKLILPPVPLTAASFYKWSQLLRVRDALI